MKKAYFFPILPFSKILTNTYSYSKFTYFWQPCLSTYWVFKLLQIVNQVKHLLIIFSILLLTSCINREDDLDTAATAPVIAEVTAVATPTNDSTPDYTFSSTEAGTITYGGPCSSSTTVAVAGNNTITLNTLSEGTYSDCTISVTNSEGNVSSIHTITSFTVFIPPILSEVTAVTTPTIDTTPNYTFSSSKAGTITYGGSCSSSTTIAAAGNNTITLNALTNGTYENCTITVTSN